MYPPDEETLRALANLGGDIRFIKVKEWIFKSLDAATKALYENTVFNAGRVAEINDMIDKIDTAKEKYDQLKVQKNLGQIRR